MLVRADNILTNLLYERETNNNDLGKQTETKFRINWGFVALVVEKQFYLSYLLCLNRTKSDQFSLVNPILRYIILGTTRRS